MALGLNRSAWMRSALSVVWVTCLTFVRENSDAIKIALAFVAAVYTAYVYSVEMRDDRVANVLSFQERAASRYLHNAFQRIDMFWIRGPGLAVLQDYQDLRDKIERDLQGKKRIDAFVDANKNRAKYTRNLVRNYDLEADIFLIYEFYRDIVVCVEQGRCDRQTACQLFARDVENFRLLYRRFFDEWRELWGNANLRTSLKYFFCDCGTDMLIGRNHPDDEPRRKEAARISRTCHT